MKSDQIGQKNKLKVLQVVSTPPLAWATGGCARVVNDLSIELAKRGNSVTILTTDMLEPNNRYNGEKKESFDKLEIVRFKNISNWLAWKYKIYCSPGIVKYLKNNITKYDIVHLHDIISIHALFTILNCKKNKIPYVVTTHGSVPWLKKENLINKIYYKFVGQNILRNACKITSLNNSESNLLKSLGIPAKRIELIPNGINLSDYNTLPPNGKFRKKFGIKEEEKIILYLGRIHSSKGIEILINSFVMVLEELKNVKLVLVGPDDGYLSYIKQKIEIFNLKKNVLITGPLYNKEKVEASIDADIFITPKFTGFPLTFLEACICSTPLIITNKGDEIPWINGNVGFISEYNEKNISNALINILTNEKLLNKLRSNCKSTIKDFGWNRIAERMEKLYESCI